MIKKDQENLYHTSLWVDTRNEEWFGDESITLITNQNAMFYEAIIQNIDLLSPKIFLQVAGLGIESSVSWEGDLETTIKMNGEIRQWLLPNRALPHILSAWQTKKYTNIVLIQPPNQNL